MLRYTRLPTDFPDSDELSGVYMGGFGAHGPEVVVVERQLKVSASSAAVQQQGTP